MLKSVMAKKWVLRFASYKTPDDIFNLVVNGQKTIETRPNTKDFNVGDKLVLVSMVSKRKIEKTISFVHIYKSPKEMLEVEDFNKIFPNIGSKEKLLEVYEIAKTKWGKKYKNELETFGIVAIGIK